MDKSLVEPFVLMDTNKVDTFRKDLIAQES